MPNFANLFAALCLRCRSVRGLLLVDGCWFRYLLNYADVG